MFKHNYGQLCGDLRYMENTLETNNYTSNKIIEIKEHIEYFETIYLLLNDGETMKFDILKSKFGEFMSLKSEFGTLDKQITGRK